MPDGLESYMSPLCFQDPASQELKLVFGSGGETMGGSLFICTLQNLMDRNLSAAQKIATEDGHGFIAPPVLADVNQDGTLDILAISHASTIFAIDGNNHKQLWQQSFPGRESSNSFAVGHFTQKDRIEILGVMDRGTWPIYSYAQQVILDGATGNTVYHDSLGCFVVSSPVVYDMDNDGLDEVILNINDWPCDATLNEEFMDPPGITYQLVAIDFQSDKHKIIDQARNFKNVFSSPWIGDLDGDKHLDIVYSYYNHPNDLRKFLGMSLKRVSTPIKIRKPVKWGAYMGSNGNGIYE
jgi:hypothetical protein